MEVAWQTWHKRCCADLAQKMLGKLGTKDAARFGQKKTRASRRLARVLLWRLFGVD